MKCRSFVRSLDLVYMYVDLPEIVTGFRHSHAYGCRDISGWWYIRILPKNIVIRKSVWTYEDIRSTTVTIILWYSFQYCHLNIKNKNLQLNTTSHFPWYKSIHLFQYEDRIGHRLNHPIIFDIARVVVSCKWVIVSDLHQWNWLKSGWQCLFICPK